ncbi:hypothetical protein GKQ38_03880 [Candidatus Nanohaloarchaea archaeon]|nr:hypothetical protein GKQ38_03880 [Candidatus Nanohaloarchaea archaeon]
MEVSISRKDKGQVFLPDFISSVVIFSFILFFFMISWNNLVESNFSQGREDLVNNAQRTKTLLLETQGYPSDWNESNVMVPGLKESGYIDAGKFLDLKNISATRRNRMFKNAFYNLTFMNNGSVASFKGQKMTIGSEINQSGDIVTLRETVAVNKSGEIALMEAVYSEWS